MAGRPPGYAKTGGRHQGTKNKITSIRQAFVEAFDALQEHPEANLKAWAAKNPNEYYKLAARLLPQDVVAKGGVQLIVSTGVPKAQKDRDAEDDGLDLV